MLATRMAQRAFGVPGAGAGRENQNQKQSLQSQKARRRTRAAGGRVAGTSSASGSATGAINFLSYEEEEGKKKKKKTRAVDVTGDEELCRQVDYVFDPARSETEPTECKQAKVPEGFPRGTYLRNGPNSKFGIGEEHYFDGDGMIHGISFLPSGKVMFFNKWIEGKGYLKEKVAGQKLYEGVLVNNGVEMISGIIKNILFNDALETQGTKDTTNTALVAHAGKVLALMEAQKPVLMHLEVGDDTVEFSTEKVNYDFDGDLVGNLTAHPKLDPRTGEMIGFSYDMAKKPHMRYTEVDSRGDVSYSIGLYDVPRGVMSHDMAITKTHAILLDLPLVFDAANFLKNEFPVQFEKNAGARLGLLERGGRGSLVQWFDIKNQANVFHTVNAFNCPETGEVVLHAMRAEPEKDGYVFNDYSPSYLHEWRLNPETNSVKERRLGELAGEFPCINPNYVGEKAEFAYTVVDGFMGRLKQWTYPPIGIVYNSLAKYDLGSGSVVDKWDCDQGLYIYEPEFVPKVDSKSEDEGFLVLFCTDAIKDKSYFCILDAQNLRNGPLSLIEVPQKIPSGLHGQFIPL